MSQNVADSFEHCAQDRTFYTDFNWKIAFMSVK